MIPICDWLEPVGYDVCLCLLSTPTLCRSTIVHLFYFCGCTLFLFPIPLPVATWSHCRQHRRHRHKLSDPIQLGLILRHPILRYQHG